MSDYETIMVNARSFNGVHVRELVSLGRAIWGEKRHTLPEIVERLMVGVGDLARLSRDGVPEDRFPDPDTLESARLAWCYEVGKELGNVVLSTLRWMDDLGFDPVECLRLAAEAQHKFASSGRPR